MKLFMLALFVSVACANPGLPPPLQGGPIRRARAISSGSSDSDVTAKIDSYESVVNPDGFIYAYKTSNGIGASASGKLEKVDAESDALVIRGGYKYNSPEGPITLTYIADQNGYQPLGLHLPLPPPTPEAILRAIKYIEEHPPAVEKF